MMKNVAVFIGTRPEAIKMVAVIKSLENTPGLNPVVISTGQHLEMLDQVVNIFGINVDHHLEVMRSDQSLISLTMRLMKKIDKLLDDLSLDLALVQGDTTTVLVASLVCFYRKIPVGHVEAGLRTNDIYSPFPEEANRRMASSIVSLHFTPTNTSKENLLKENVPESSIHVTGNTVIDALFMEIERQKIPAVSMEITLELNSLLPENWRDRPYILITGHRRENFGKGFMHICTALSELAEKYDDYNFIYPVHLNPNVQEPVYSILNGHQNILLIPPVDYGAFVFLMNNCHLILTDSGGVQEEAPSLGKPVLVMREKTERPEGIQAGSVKLTGTKKQDIVRNVSSLIEDDNEYTNMAQAINPYGDGQAAERITSIISSYPF
jgi:UDP-N-acetylglucosamine 2-epimerase (non-hydrolysing)